MFLYTFLTWQGNICCVMNDEVGEMLEWLKRHAWKACKLQKGFRGSNPRLSAKILLQAVEVSLLTSPSLRKG